ncbi:hypothetical protein AB9P05_19350 [Roseivirga sp. BDSF3-8]|uniref:hypothetical protein n=1 Tax=Roseivirga sp. BDSF3-8 TaxID=3241598 RepID=UPI0035323889
MNEAYSRDLEAFTPLLEDIVPAPAAVMFQSTTQNEFFNEGKLVALITLNENEAASLAGKLSMVNNGEGEYLPEIVKEWFPQEVKANFYQMEEGEDLLASKVPQYNAGELLKSPYQSGPAFIIGNYVLIIGQSI